MYSVNYFGSRIQDKVEEFHKRHKFHFDLLGKLLNYLDPYLCIEGNTDKEIVLFSKIGGKNTVYF